MMISEKWILILACLLFQSCQETTKPDLEAEKTALLASNEQQRIAHLERRPNLLMEVLADTVMTIQNGTFNISTATENEARWKNYFASVEYYKWEDLEDPVIYLSEDGTQATVGVKKITVSRYYQDSLNSADDATIFAWTSTYKKQEGQWKIHQISSTRNTLENIDPHFYFEKGMALIAEDDWGTALGFLANAFSLQSENWNYALKYAEALIRSGRTEEALAILQDWADIGLRSMPEILETSWFQALPDSPAMQRLKESVNLLRTPKGDSETYAIVPERQLIPEGITADPNSGSLFLSSTYLRKIVEITSEKEILDFASSGSDGLFSTVGMEVDETRKHLWVISSSAHAVLPMIDGDRAPAWVSKVYQYDLESRKLLQIYELKTEAQVFLNDLTVASNGDVFLSETMGKRIYKIQQGANELDLFYEDTWGNEFYNGLVLSANEAVLYQSHTYGILRIDTQTGTLLGRLAHPANISLGAIDGLAQYKGHLIAHQTGLTGGIELYQLNERGDKVVSRKTLLRNHPDFDQASTGEILGDDYLLIANAQMQSAFKDGIIKEETALKDVVILQLDLSGI